MKLLAAFLLAVIATPAVAAAKNSEAGRVVLTSCASAIRPSTRAVALGNGSAVIPRSVCFFKRAGMSGSYILVDREAWMKQGREGENTLYRYIGDVQDHVIQPSSAAVVRVAEVRSFDVGSISGFGFGERDSLTNEFFVHDFRPHRVK